MDKAGVSVQRCCEGTGQPDTSLPAAISAACQHVLRGKAAAMLSAGKAQVVQRTAYLFKPRADATALDCFQPAAPA